MQNKEQLIYTQPLDLWLEKADVDEHLKELDLQNCADIFLDGINTEVKQIFAENLIDNLHNMFSGIIIATHE